MTLEDVEAAIRLIGTLGAVVGAIAGWTFVISYRRDPWHRYPAGIHLMRFTAGLSFILTYIVAWQLVAQVVPPNPLLDFLVVVARAVIFCWTAWQLVIRAQMLADAHRKEKTLSVVLHDRNRLPSDTQVEEEPSS